MLHEITVRGIEVNMHDSNLANSQGAHRWHAARLGRAARAQGVRAAEDAQVVLGRGSRRDLQRRQGHCRGPPCERAAASNRPRAERLDASHRGLSPANGRRRRRHLRRLGVPGDERGQPMVADVRPKRRSAGDAARQVQLALGGCAARCGGAREAVGSRADETRARRAAARRHGA